MISIFYTCELCGLRDVDVRLPYRPSDMDVVVWMKEHVGVALSKDHAERSPHCLTTSLTNVKIPVPAGTQWVGGPVQQ